MFGNFSVPFYLYLPEKYRENSFFDKNRLGSHRDIFPTIFSSIFSNAKYFASGSNLLAKDYIQTFAINKNFIANEQGAVLIGTKPRFYQWRDGIGDDLEKINPNNAKSLFTAYQKESYQTTMDLAFSTRNRVLTERLHFNRWKVNFLLFSREVRLLNLCL